MSTKESETPTCPKCGAGCLSTIQQWNGLDWLCQQCGHQWNDRAESYDDELRIEQRRLAKETVAKAQELARSLSAGQAREMVEQLKDIRAAVLNRWNKAFAGTSSAARQAIYSSADQEKPQTFRDWFRRWIGELIELQKFIVDELLPMPLKYQIPSAELRAWLDVAFEVIWGPLEPGYTGWILVVLEGGTVPKTWVAPKWLWSAYGSPTGPLPSDPSNATQALLAHLRIFVELRVRSGPAGRENAIRDACRRVRVQLPTTEDAELNLEAEEAPAAREAKDTPPPNQFQRLGEIWFISYAGRLVTLEHLVGLKYLQELLRNPGRPLSADKLVSLETLAPDSIDPPEGLEAQTGSWQQQIDEKARRKIKEEIRELVSQLTAAEHNDDEPRASELEKKIERLKKDMKSGSREFPTTSEKNRSSVTQAVNRAIKKIENEHHALGEHLLSTVRTGKDCWYLDQDTRWSF